MLGEVGLDGGARMRWPNQARHMYPEQSRVSSETDISVREPAEDSGEKEDEEEDMEWKRLTPFKVSMNHQKEILRMQIEIAIELGVNVSLHSVQAAGKSFPLE